jgi:hypothetical protein
MSDDQAVWIYVVGACPFPGVPEAMTGVGGEDVRVIEAAGLFAVVGSVSLAEFGEEALRRKLDDITTLEAMARSHHRVVDSAAILKQRRVVPARLTTMCHDDSGVSAMLTKRRDDFMAVLEQTAGCTEWGVKAYAARSPAADRGSSAPSGVGGGESPGRAYLQRRRAQLSAADEARAAALASAEDVHTALLRLARSARRHPPHEASLSGSREPMVLNGAYLVADESGESFAATVSMLDRTHPAVRLELTGPWPPYSFQEVGSELTRT